ncbi:MAG: redox-regulated ATPase YchF [Endomicrobiales bacterium]|jgi:GTP-binding protein YchF
MEIGIVGLPNVGKSTLFNALTKAGAGVANYPFCTIDPNVGVVPVPDARLDYLTELYKPKKKVPAIVRFVDIAGLVKGASQGEGLGNQFLATIRETEAIAHVVRCFDDKDITHIAATVDPKRDIEIVNTELLLADLDTVSKKLAKLERNIKAGDKKTIAEKALAERLCRHLGDGKPARSFISEPGDEEFFKDYYLLTSKPVIYVCNVGESDLPSMKNSYTEQVEVLAESEGAQAIPVCGKIEAELSELSEQDQLTFLKDLGLTETGLNRLIRSGYAILDLISYFTAGADECRAWTIGRGTLAPQAAGKIHTDFERGFIRAEVMAFDDLKRLGSDKAVRDAGLFRQEGKSYTVKDGDIIEFRFNV